MVSPTFAARASPSRSRFPANACGCGCPCAHRADRPARAALIEVLEPSPHRVAPPCPHFGPQPTRTPPCGGCAWQHIAYPEQLRIKTDTVSRAVRAAVPGAPPVQADATATPDPWGFRHKVHFAFGDSARPADDGASGARLAPRRARGRVPRARRARATPWPSRCATRAAAPASAAGSPASRRQAALRGVAVRVGHASHETLATLVVAHDRDRDAARRHAARARRRRGRRAAPERAPARRRDDLRRGHPEAARDRPPARGRGAASRS